MLLSAEQEAALAVAIANGDKEAKVKLVEGNIRLVASIAKRHASPEMPLQDLIQEGCIGLIKAAERFDVNRGHRFSTYATYWIRQTIARAIAAQHSSIRVPVHVHESLARLLKVKGHLAQELGREPTEIEISIQQNVSASYVERLLQATKITISLDAANGESDDSSLSATLTSNDHEIAIDRLALMYLRRSIDAAMKRLTDRQRQVILLRFGLGDGACHTLEEIGSKLGITRERVHQIEKKALKTLRQPSCSGQIRRAAG